VALYGYWLQIEKLIYKFIKYRFHLSAIFIYLLYYGCYQAIGAPPQLPVILAFSIWHFALYIFDRAYDGELDKISQPQEAITLSERKWLLPGSVILAFIPFLILKLSKLPVLPYLYFFPVTFLYTFPVFPGGKRFKNFLLIKNLYSAILIWTLPIALVIQYYILPRDNFWSYYLQHYFPAILFVVFGEISWDIRDIKGDKENKVDTIPLRIGVNGAKIIMAGILLLDIIVEGTFFREAVIINAVFLIFIRHGMPNWIYHIPALVSFVEIIITVSK
jgi:4-hydroxybenzoate polyprenyltransferase